MKLSVVIVNYKTAGLTRACVRGILSAQTTVSYEVIVVDNSSGDGIGEWLLVHAPQAVFIPQSANRGYAAGVNAGIRAAQGEYVLVLNPDIIVTSGALEQLVGFMEQHPRCGLAGPKLVNPDGSLQYSCYRFPTFWLPLFRRTFLGAFSRIDKRSRHYQMMDWNHQENREVDWLLGACLMVRASALTEVGLMDERYFLYVEDTDWCRSFREQGWQVWYAAEVLLTHFHERASAQASILTAFFNKITWIHIASWVKYFWKWRNV